MTSFPTTLGFILATIVGWRATNFSKIIGTNEGDIGAEIIVVIALAPHLPKYISNCNKKHQMQKKAQTTSGTGNTDSHDAITDS